MANNNCTKRERFCPLPLLFSAKISCQATALQQRTRLPVSRRYTAGRGQPALRKRSEEKPSVHRNGRMGHPALRPPRRKSSVHRKKQPNKPQHTKKARLTACLSTRKAHGIPFPAAFRRSRNRQGQVCRSRPHKIPHKSQGVYLTFIPLPRDACPEPRPPCGREGDIRDSFLGNCPGI